jgi:hypothetical protein
VQERPRHDIRRPARAGERVHPGGNVHADRGRSSGLREALHELQRRVGDVLPTVVDRE